MGSRLERRLGAPPLYAQVVDLLRARLVSTGLRPGDRFPSEPELVAELGVSRSTIAKAMEVLQRDGLISRQQGRGTFVGRYPLDRRLPELTSFSEHVTGLGLEAGQRFVGYERRIIPPGEPDTLLAAFPVGAEVAVSHRVRLVTGLPVGTHRTVVPADVADRIGFTEEALRTEAVSLYALFERHGIHLATAEEHLQAHNADGDEATLLDVEPGTALMHVRRLSRDSGGALVEAVDARYVGSFYDYRVDLARTPQPSDRSNEKGHAHEALADVDTAGPVHPAGGSLRR